jgi:NAD(P)-dependent dehydrogenase (short-subunit alcohol dehydrogenase family)
LVFLLGVVSHYIQPFFDAHTKGVIVITGASTGIGASAAVKLARLGFTVFAGVRSIDGVTVFDGVENVVPIVIDVTSAETIEAAVLSTRKYSEKFRSPLIGVICNAGVGSGAPKPVEHRADDEDFAVFDVNYHGVAKTAKRFMPELRKTKGSRLIIIGSVSGNIASPMGQPYSATKFAVRSLADSLRRELKPAGVSVSRIEPGYVNTAMEGKNKVGTDGLSAFELLEPSERAPYENLWNRTIRSKGSMALHGAPTQVTDRDIAHSIISTRPQPVYYPGNVAGEYPARVLVFIIDVLSVLGPSWVDFALSAL